MLLTCCFTSWVPMFADMVLLCVIYCVTDVLFHFVSSYVADLLFRFVSSYVADVLLLYVKCYVTDMLFHFLSSYVCWRAVALREILRRWHAVSLREFLCCWLFFLLCEFLDCCFCPWQHMLFYVFFHSLSCCLFICTWFWWKIGCNLQNSLMNVSYFELWIILLLQNKYTSLCNNIHRIPLKIKFIHTRRV